MSVNYLFGDLELTPAAGHMVLHADGAGFRFTPNDDGRTGLLTAEILIRGANRVAMRDNQRAIEGMIDRATRMARNRHGQYLTFTGRVGDAGEWVTWQVLGGDQSRLTEVRLLNPSHLQATLTLLTLPLGRGDVVTLDQTGVLDNGGSVLVAGVPGDGPAWCRVDIEDESTGDLAINQVRIAQRAGENLEVDDYRFVWDLEAAGDGSAELDDNAFGGSHIAGSTSGSGWRTIAKVERPTPLTNGHLDLYLRMLDPVPSLAAPSGFSGGFAGARATEIQHVVTSDADTDEILIEYPQATQPDTTLLMSVHVHTTVSEAEVQKSLSVGAGWVASGLIQDGFGGSQATRTYMFRWLHHPGGRTQERISFEDTLSGIIGVNIYEFRGEFTGQREAGNAVNVTVTSHPSGTTSTDGDARVAVTAHTFGMDATISDYTADWTVMANGGKRGSAYRILDASGSVSATATSSDGTRSSNRITALTGPIPTTATLAPGNYIYQLAHRTAAGSRGMLSEAVFVQVPFEGRVTLQWDSLPAGASNSTLFFQHTDVDGNVNGWRAINVGGGTSYDHDGAQGSSVSGQPHADLVPTQARLQIASGTTGQVLKTLTGVDSEDRLMWRMLHMATQHVPPALASFGSDPEDWIVFVQTRHPYLSVTPLVDAIWAAPHDESQIEARYRPMDLGVPHDFRLDALRNGEAVGLLLDDSAVVGDLATRGHLTLSGGDNILSLMLAGEDGESNVEHLKARLQVRYRAGYRSLRGEL